MPKRKHTISIYRDAEQYFLEIVCKTKAKAKSEAKRLRTKTISKVRVAPVKVRGHKRYGVFTGPTDKRQSWKAKY